jgi:anti-sigma regulatory factor (Ser/Thr protein kinase)
MTKGKGQSAVPDAIDLLAQRETPFSAGEVARLAGVTRQAAHHHLARMVQAGVLQRLGAGRGSRYMRAWEFRRSYRLAGLDESEAWRDVLAEIPRLQRLPQNMRSLVSYCFTEMLNNAIDHSAGRQAVVTVWRRNETLVVEIVDDGIGVFRRIREQFRLPDDLASIAELAKGKRTTFPERHSGEGIFFTSKAADQFQLESGGHRWRVDNPRQDMAVGRSETRRGTRVSFEVDLARDRSLRDVFAVFASGESAEFDRSEFTVRLFETGSAFVSRSEAKRLAAGLDQFQQITLDFDGVDEVGQGFVDELFRVWSRDHPATRLLPVNMNDDVRFMVERGLPPH